MFEHFLITRFNLSLGRSENLNIDPDWLDRRFELFESYCFPSVRAQTEQNFKWLVFFDERTPEPYKEKIKSYALWSNFLPIYVGHHYKLLDLLKSTVLESLNDDATHVITTRLDNDDAIYRDFVKEVQACFEAQTFQYVSFSNGYVLKSGELYRFKYPGNPFNSLIEKVRDPEYNSLCTCFRFRHEEAADGALTIAKPPAWMQVIHGDNIANRTRGFRQFSTSQEEISNAFSIDQNCIGVDQSRLVYSLYWCQDIFWYLLDFAIMQFNRHQFFRNFMSRSVRQSVKRRLLRI